MIYTSKHLEVIKNRYALVKFVKVHRSNMHDIQEVKEDEDDA